MVIEARLPQPFRLRRRTGAAAKIVRHQARRRVPLGLIARVAGARPFLTRDGDSPASLNYLVAPYFTLFQTRVVGVVPRTGAGF